VNSGLITGVFFIVQISIPAFDLSINILKENKPSRLLHPGKFYYFQKFILINYNLIVLVSFLQ